MGFTIIQLLRLTKSQKFSKLKTDLMKLKVEMVKGSIQEVQFHELCLARWRLGRNGSNELMECVGALVGK
ncbi:hypothetical protein QVD17_37661 [Tagetes erecta]|uniref:Uncharacterized protein n=1 Tax=Tagetes erecta TaxID=13708 RepID=A0AAD8JYP5_TARER|nr:hypothetical protein QVD17_37661 [Tagetes erecta]